MFEANLKYQKTITMVTEVCCNCGIAFGIPSDFQEVLKNNPQKSFYCPNGHGQHYAFSKDAKARQEAENKLRRTEEELANLAASKIQLENELKKAQGKLSRVHNGTCPCCNRSFSNLNRHMKSKHPELLKK